jgi:hypothetical protein
VCVCDYERECVLALTLLLLHTQEDQQLSDARKLGYVNRVIRNNEILNKACREAQSQDPASSFSVKSISSHERDVSLRYYILHYQPSCRAE